MNTFLLGLGAMIQLATAFLSTAASESLPKYRNVGGEDPTAVARKQSEAFVRKQSEAYTKALLGCDKVALFSLLHDEYLGERVKWGRSGPTSDKEQAIVFFNDPHKVIMTAGKVKTVEFKISSVRVFGDTAIETGSMSAEVGEHTYGRVGYVRVWLKTNGYWQLAHEKYD
jgi:ketosteroid isomerase-like protein